MRCRVAVILLLLTSFSFADIVDDIRTALAQNNLAAANSALQNYRAQHGVDPQFLEALSWQARGALAAKQLDQATSAAKETETLVRQQLQKRPLDADPHLSTALGAALEVQAQVLAAQGYQAQAVALLRHSLVTYGKTSIAPRLQKNLNLLALTGQPAPPLNVADYLGVRPT